MTTDKSKEKKDSLDEQYVPPVSWYKKYYIVCDKHGKLDNYMTFEFTEPKITICLGCVAEFCRDNFKSYEIKEEV